MPNFRNRMATQCVKHQKSPNFGRFMPGGTVAVPAWSTPMPLYINNILCILMIIYGDSSYLFTNRVAYTAEIRILPITVHIGVFFTLCFFTIVFRWHYLMLIFFLFLPYKLLRVIFTQGFKLLVGKYHARVQSISGVFETQIQVIFIHDCH